MIKKIKQKIDAIKYSLNYYFGYLEIFNTPFIKPKIKVYFGDVSIGIPYFLPRKWVKLTKKEAIESAKEELERENIKLYYKDKSFDYIVKSKLGTKKAVDKKFGFNFCTLGWKTKWDDIVFEYEPRISFVAFKKQLVISLRAPIDFRDVYWEAYLNYKSCTKILSKQERIYILTKNYSCTWRNSEKEYTNYYYLILKEKYLKNIAG